MSSQVSSTSSSRPWSLGALLVYYHVSLTVHAFIAIPTIAVLTVFTVAVSFVLSTIQVRYRDVGVAMPLVLQLWMFATPDRLPAQRRPDSDGGGCTSSIRWSGSSRACVA